MSAQINPSDLRPGDVLLHVGTGEISKLVQWVSDSDYSHAALIYDVGLLAEAVEGGVIIDEPLAPHLADTGQFARIDAYRLRSSPGGVTPPALTALQTSARKMDGVPFALNQLMEIGIIAAVRNKLPTTAAGQMFMTWLLNDLMPRNTDRLVCSEFVYLSFHLSGVAELDPQIVLASRAIQRKPFPDIDWGALWQEYQDAKSAEQPDPPPTLVAALSGAPALGNPDAASLAALNVAVYQAKRRLVQDRPELFAAPAPEGLRVVVHPNPVLVLPQDLADSPSFGVLGPIARAVG